MYCCSIMWPQHMVAFHIFLFFHTFSFLSACLSPLIQKNDEHFFDIVICIHTYYLLFKFAKHWRFYIVCQFSAVFARLAHIFNSDSLLCLCSHPLSIDKVRYLLHSKSLLPKSGDNCRITDPTMHTSCQS